ncbi:MAG: hypothetical protein BIFFINMI_02579 [Phycisphaerae bacterium]|nr:hypothetical protein [Phycisphaerae bacterium]
MYREYYRLREDPFNITPDPRFLYLTPHHQEAMNHLLFGIRQRKGFICLTGEVGAGKTTLCRALLNQLDSQFHTALILNPMLTETQLLRAAVAEFGIQSPRCDRLGYMGLLNDWLLKVNGEGHDAVLIIDEAQDMPDKTLEMTRLLSNLETMSQKLLQIVFVGQPELRERLARGKFRQLAQRVTVRYHLTNMTREQTREYVEHRLRVAAGESANPGDSPVRFDDRALEEVFRHSSGTPRLVNAICDKSLLAGFVHRTSLIDRNLVRLAVDDLKEAG